MDAVTISLCCIASFCLLYIVVKHYWQCSRRPPGPWGLPLVGILLRDLLHEMFSSKMEEKIFFLTKNVEGEVYRRKNGLGIWSFQMGMQHIVFLHSYEAIREALIDNAE